MLRISIITDSDKTTRFLLEGSLTGPWVGELQRLCQKALKESKAVVLDLERLRYVDWEGVAMLRELSKKRVAHLNGSAFIRQQLREGTYDVSDEY